MDKLPVQTAPLLCPPLADVAQVLQDGLRENFASATVSVVDCPDLKQEPFLLTTSGLCGSCRLVEAGGVQNLVPVPKRDKLYDIHKMAKLAGMESGSSVLGAGGCPNHAPDTTAELFINLLVDEVNDSTVALDNSKDGSHGICKCDCGLSICLANLFLSEGKCGKVLEVKAANRTGNQDIVLCMRTSLAAKYGDKALGLGGVLLLEKGKAKIHIAPTFSEKPIHTDEEMMKWLHMYEVPAPVVCLGTFVTQITNLDLRMQHFHCSSKHGDGGHFHTDTTPADAQYLGYFNLGESMVRVDQPQQSHKTGRMDGN
ncbi:Ester hydrolase [Lamellibrachia satsuma]|nr:Ester hydrolase [Lamellibrachia satsuma]